MGVTRIDKVNNIEGLERLIRNKVYREALLQKKLACEVYSRKHRIHMVNEGTVEGKKDWNT